MYNEARHTVKGVITMSKKKKRKKKRSVPYYSQRDFHHFLYPRRRWDEKFYAHLLRNHNYCGDYILKYTVHHNVHEAVTNVPMPNDDVCSYVVCRLNELYSDGVISNDDSAVKRISILIDLFEGIADDTAEALKIQREVMKRG